MITRTIPDGVQMTLTHMEMTLVPMIPTIMVIRMKTMMPSTPFLMMTTWILLRQKIMKLLMTMAFQLMSITKDLRIQDPKLGPHMFQTKKNVHLNMEYQHR